ncbi:MAG: hypothetical protein KJ955_04145 [Nanoarchaeota archaeon]|nr:hypothetical protein [Nanoarchaeota archaeon]
MTKTQKLEERIFFDSGITFENARTMRIQGVHAETAFISDAYFGRWPNPGFRGKTPMGLNIVVVFDSFDTATLMYTDPKQTKEIMDAFGTHSSGMLARRGVTAYTTNGGQHLVGLSVRGRIK